MKTAEEWWKQYNDSSWTIETFIANVQLDAMKEGMRRAAKEIDPRFVLNRKAILTASEQLTTKDL